MFTPRHVENDQTGTGRPVSTGTCHTQLWRKQNSLEFKDR